MKRRIVWIVAATALALALLLLAVSLSFAGPRPAEKSIPRHLHEQQRVAQFVDQTMNHLW